MSAGAPRLVTADDVLREYHRRGGTYQAGQGRRRLPEELLTSPAASPGITDNAAQQPEPEAADAVASSSVEEQEAMETMEVSCAPLKSARACHVYNTCTPGAVHQPRVCTTRWHARRSKVDATRRRSQRRKQRS